MIIETGDLSDKQKLTVVTIAVEAGAEFKKIFTGFGPGRAIIHDINLFENALGDKILTIGGMTSFEDTLSFSYMPAQVVWLTILI